MAKATICPLQNLGKNLERKHTWRNLVQYRNCQLNQNMHGKYILSHIVRSKFILKSRVSDALLNTYASCSTKRGEHTCQSLHHVTLLWTWLVPGRLHTRDTAQGEIRTEKGCASGDGSSVLLLRALHAYMKTTGDESVYVLFSNYWMRPSRIWRILQIKEGVIHRGRWPRWITPSEICRILHILRKPNSIIALLFIQNTSRS